MKSQSAKRYPPELRERAVRMLLEHRDDYDSETVSSWQIVADRPNQLWCADFTYGVPAVQGEHGCSNEPRVVCLEC